MSEEVLSYKMQAYGLRNIADNAVDDLRAIGSLMVKIGRNIPDDEVDPQWFVWLGRQIDAISDEINSEAREIV
jgi:hypothetical protein